MPDAEHVASGPQPPFEGALLHGAVGDEPQEWADAAGPAPARARAIVVEDEPGVQAMLTELLDDRRVEVAVGLSPAGGDEEQPVLPLSGVRAVVGERARIYQLVGEFPVRRLEEELGRRLSLCAEAARIWWPGLTRSSDPADHPLVLVLDGESAESALGELARQLDLSRPYVRREIKVLEDLLAMAEHNLALANTHRSKIEERLRDAHRERHREAMRAERAERAAED